MSHVIEVIVANKALFAALGALLLSELMPFLPTKANGIAQAALGLLKKEAGK